MKFIFIFWVYCFQSVLVPHTRYASLIPSHHTVWTLLFFSAASNTIFSEGNNEWWTAGLSASIYEVVKSLLISTKGHKFQNDRMMLRLKVCIKICCLRIFQLRSPRPFGILCLLVYTFYSFKWRKTSAFRCYLMNNWMGRYEETWVGPFQVIWKDAVSNARRGTVAWTDQTHLSDTASAWLARWMRIRRPRRTKITICPIKRRIDTQCHISTRFTEKNGDT